MENDNKGKKKAKYPCLLCGGYHFTKEFPLHEEISKFIKSNPTPAVLNNPFPSQQQLIDHMSNQGTSSSIEEIIIMSSNTINLNTHSHSYDKSIEKKDKILLPRKFLLLVPLRLYLMVLPLSRNIISILFYDHLRLPYRRLFSIPMPELHIYTMWLKTWLRNPVQCLPQRYSKVVQRSVKTC